MQDNIIKLQERSGKLDELDERAKNLEKHAQMFNKNANDIHREMWCMNLKRKSIIWGVILAILTVVILIIVIPIITK